VNDRPTAEELLRAVERFLEEDVVPQLEGPARFHARVAANVVAIVAREIETQDAQLAREWEGLAALLGGGGARPEGRAALRAAIAEQGEALARRIRGGEADAGPFRAQVLAHLRETTRDKLAVSQPPRIRRGRS
jgi:hypothetical protein